MTAQPHGEQSLAAATAATRSLMLSSVASSWALHRSIHAKKKLQPGIIIQFSVLCFWVKNTIVYAGTCHFTGIFQPLPGSRLSSQEQGIFACNFILSVGRLTNSRCSLCAILDDVETYSVPRRCRHGAHWRVTNGTSVRVLYRSYRVVVRAPIHAQIETAAWNPPIGHFENSSCRRTQTPYLVN